MTQTRQFDLLDAAERVEREASHVAQVLRESRLELWCEDVEDQLYPLAREALGETLAQYYTRVVLHGRLTVPSDPGAWETVVEDHGLTWTALRTQIPELEDFTLAEARSGELAAQDPASPVPRRQWAELSFRSWSEVCIAQALDRANVVFVPNPSVRLGITQDHRENVEPDFIVIANGKTGILEVDGAPWHPPERSAAEGERDRRFREHGIAVVERFDANECRRIPDDVVARFLRLLALNG
ncbi:MAG TPA: hypothetical protein VII01_12795 [Solirubrobacteraceae bacterium]